MLAFFFFNDTATTEIYTLSLHDALPISQLMRSARALTLVAGFLVLGLVPVVAALANQPFYLEDRKSTRLNSSHGYISHAVFCFKKQIPGAGAVRNQRLLDARGLWSSPRA